MKEDTLEFFSPIDINCFSQSGLKIKQKVKKMVTWTDFKKNNLMTQARMLFYFSTVQFYILILHRIKKSSYVMHFLKKI